MVLLMQSKLLLLLLLLIVIPVVDAAEPGISPKHEPFGRRTIVQGSSIIPQSMGNILETANNSSTAIKNSHYYHNDNNNDNKISQSAKINPRSLPNILDWLLLLSPQTWLGVLEIQDLINMGSIVSYQSLLKGVWGVLIPYVVLWLSRGLLTLNNPVKTPPILWLCWISSPWSLACYQRILSQLMSVWPTLYSCGTRRAVVLSSAITTLEQRVQNRRAYRTPRYDVYLPDQSLLLLQSLTTLNQTTIPSNQRIIKQQALLFFPGALVPHLAYSEVAARLSDAGLVVVVVSMEPLRLAYHRLGTDRQSMQRIMRQVTNHIWQFGSSSSSSSSSKVDDTMMESPTTVEWTLMGHSMGSFAAMKLFDEIHSLDSCSLDDEMMTVSKKLVVWGMAAFIGFATNLSTYHNAEMLVVQGSNDHYRKLLQAKNEELETHFPIQTTMNIISGGTHDGFGSYAYPATDGNNSTTASDKIDQERIRQQEEACRITTEFLL
jgi:hypothetical protein